MISWPHEPPGRGQRLALDEKQQSPGLTLVPAPPECWVTLGRLLTCSPLSTVRVVPPTLCDKTKKTLGRKDHRHLSVADPQ